MKNSFSQSYSVHRYNSINELPVIYDDFFEKSAHSYFLTRSWFGILENTTRPEQDQFFYLTVEMDAAPIALMALRTPAGQLGSALQEYNTGNASIASLTNWYSCLYDLLLSPAINDTDVVIQMLIHDLKIRLGQGAVIEFNYLNKNSATIGPLIRALRSEGLITLSYPHNCVIYEDVSGSGFDGYQKKRSKSFRYDVKRNSRRINEKFQIKCIIYDDDSQLEKVLTEYQEVYAKSWKRPERYPQFIPELFRQGLARRFLQVAVLYLDGKPVAADIYIVFNGQAVSYKGAYDPDYKNPSVSTELMIFAFERLIEVDGVSEMNLSYGDEPYKRRWLSQRRGLIGILAFNPRSVRGLWLLFKHIGSRLVQKFIYIKNNHR